MPGHAVGILGGFGPPAMQASERAAAHWALGSSTQQRPQQAGAHMLVHMPTQPLLSR